MIERTRDRPRVVKKDDPGGKGREIVRELRVCPSCKTGHTPTESQLHPT